MVINVTGEEKFRVRITSPDGDVLTVKEDRTVCISGSKEKCFKEKISEKMLNILIMRAWHKGHKIEVGKKGE